VKRSAGLPLSVGSASLGVRILIATVFAVTAMLCIGGGILIARVAMAARIVAILLIVPLGIAGVVAAAFVLAPWSRFGVWLDAFVTRLREPRIAVAAALILWAIAFLLTGRTV
jgi:hypothetical protein